MSGLEIAPVRMISMLIKDQSHTNSLAPFGKFPACRISKRGHQLEIFEKHL